MRLGDLKVKTVWAWPGARWWRCDLHLHSPGSHDFADPQTDASAWVEAALTSGLDVVAVTDHNSAQFIDAVKEEPRVAGGVLVVLAGVELTSAEGVHLLALLSQAATADEVKGLLGATGVDAGKWGEADARASYSYFDCVELAASKHGAICIAPHADAIPTERNSCKASLLEGIGDSANLRRVLMSRCLLAAEVVADDETRHERLRGIGRGRREPGLSLVRFSDAHSLAQVGRRSTWIKMTTPSLEGLGLAFTDGARSVREHRADVDPNEPPALAIESIKIENARVAGRSAPLALPFNPWFNALIGGRGSGKSTVVEMLRLALGRQDDLPASMAAKFRDFARPYAHRDDLGALTDKTQIEVCYRKTGAHFRVLWATGEEPRLEEEEDGSWVEADGTVKQRLPVQIYSQNQIHEVAKDPLALLRIVDASADVDRASWADSHGSELANFLALRAQGRKLRLELSREQETQGALAEVAGKLSVFESNEHREVLAEYERRRRQARPIERRVEEMTLLAAQLRGTAEHVELEDIDQDVFEQADDTDRSLLDLIDDTKASIDRARAKIFEAVDVIENAARDLEARRDKTTWFTAVTKANEAYTALVSELRAADIGDPGEFAGLVDQREELRERLVDLDRRKADLAKLDIEDSASLDRLAELRRDLTDRRQAFLTVTLAGNDLVEVNLEALGDRDEATSSLRDLLGLEGSFEDDLDACVDDLFSSETGRRVALASLKTKLRAVAQGDDEAHTARDRRFLTRLKRLSPEDLDRLDAWFPEDRLHTRFAGSDGNFKPLDQGSAGEKNAAVLGFLLSYGDEPIVIDQPESDLDNRLISSLVVKSLLASKKHRQLVIVTHNPNMVVNGDAELVVAMDLPAGEVLISSTGGLQEDSVREEICDVMEGGRDAFEQRYSRIGRKSSA